MGNNKGLEDVISCITKSLVIYSKIHERCGVLWIDILDVYRLRKSAIKTSRNKFSSGIITYDLISDLINLIDFSNCLSNFDNIKIESSYDKKNGYTKSMTVNGDGDKVTCVRTSYPNIINMGLTINNDIGHFDYSFSFLVSSEFITDSDNKNFTEEDYYKKVMMYVLYKYALLPYLERTIPTTKELIKRYLYGK